MLVRILKTYAERLNELDFIPTFLDMTELK